MAYQKANYKRNTLGKYTKRKLDLLDKSWLEPPISKSSFSEQAVLFYIRRYFPTASKLKTKEISEIDIYIPELRVGIEYDGPPHKQRVKSDMEKTKKCTESGIELIRMREYSLPIIQDESYKIILKNDSFEALNDGIIELLEHLRVVDISVDVKKDFMEISDAYVKSIDLDWYQAYDKLIEYYNKHGNINVPIYYKNSDGFLLGHWLSNMRHSLKNPSVKNIRITSFKVKLLDELGMDWSPIESQWEKKYSYAVKYYADNGDLLVPNKYVMDGNIRLGAWIGTQRYSYKQGKLSKEKIELLEKIGMIWSVIDYEWMKKYSLAAEYYKRNGNLIISDSPKNNDLSELIDWLVHQRQKYQSGKLSKEKRGLLENIGMVWSLYDLRWYEFFDLAVEFFRVNGNLLVPVGYITNNNKRLGNWIYNQRRKYKSQRLSEERIKLLEKIGMVWKLSEVR